MIALNCKMCGMFFITFHHSTKYCSEKCRKLAKALADADALNPRDDERYFHLDRPGYRWALEEYGTRECAIAYADALDEGRVDPDLCPTFGVDQGRHLCPVCGMRWKTRNCAVACCEGAQPCVPMHDTLPSSHWTGPNGLRETEGVPDPYDMLGGWG